MFSSRNFRQPSRTSAVPLIIPKIALKSFPILLKRCGCEIKLFLGVRLPSPGLVRRLPFQQSLIIYNKTAAGSAIVDWARAQALCCIYNASALKFRKCENKAAGWIVKNQSLLRGFARRTQEPSDSPHRTGDTRGEFPPVHGSRVSRMRKRLLMFTHYEARGGDNTVRLRVYPRPVGDTGFAAFR